MHPLYKPGDVDHDIGLIQVGKPSAYMQVHMYVLKKLLLTCIF
jgi:hypothetical protein